MINSNIEQITPKMEGSSMEKTDQQIFEEFSSQLCKWGENGKTPAAGNQDISYGLELQKKRLEKYHTKMEYRLKPQEDRYRQISTAVFSDIRYTNKLVWKAYRKEVNYSKDGRKILSVKDNELLYTIITWLNDAEVQADYCCPNCGAMSDVNALLEGCPYCHTQFIMSDLFPKVTNFYFLRDYGLSEKEAGKRITKWMAGGAGIGFLIRLPGMISDLSHGYHFFFLLFSVLLTMGVTAVFGYFALSFSMFFRVLKDSFKQAPRAVGQIRAKKQLTELMKQYDPGFTFEYFFGKVQALLKIIIFTDDRNGLAIYDGPLENCSFDNLIDAQFDGAVSLKGSRIEGQYCYLDLNVYMTDVYCSGDKLHRKPDLFQIGLCRNISRPVDYGFSIKQVNCKNCGGSFDATRERFCPYCNSRYDLREDDWIITYIKKI